MVSGGSDHYRTLGVAPDATAGEVRDAHRALARRHHPDLFTDATERLRAERRMAAVNAAWHVLGDPGRRAEYDESRRPPAPRPRPAPEPVHVSDAFQDVEVSPAAGCALRLAPIALLAGVLLAILIVTALMTGGGESPTGFDVGDCVLIEEYGMEVVPCTGAEPEIVARGVAGTSCPAGAVAVVLPTRTEQVCVRRTGG